MRAGAYRLSKLRGLLLRKRATPYTMWDDEGLKWLRSAEMREFLVNADEV